MTAATTTGMNAVDRILNVLDELEQVIEELREAAKTLQAQWEEDNDAGQR